LIVEIRGLVTPGRTAKLQVMLIGNCISWPIFMQFARYVEQMGIWRCGR